MTFARWVPSPVVNLTIRWVSNLIVCFAPTLSSGEDTLMIRGGEYDGDLLLGLLLGVLLLVLDEILLVQACKCSEPLVEALVLALELLLGVDVLLAAEPVGVGDL